MSDYFRKMPLLATIGVLAALAVIASGCGNGSGYGSSPAAASTSSSSDSGAAAPTSSSGGETVKISETEYSLTPSDVKVKPGTVTFDVSNDGETVHGLEVEGPDGDQDLASDLQPGDTGELSVDLSKPGTYEMYCPIDDHKGMGMTGEITVAG